MHKKTLFVITATFLFLSFQSRLALAQSDAPKLELGGQFVMMRFGVFNETDPGVGGRITYYVHPHIALESEVNFFHGDFEGGLARVSSWRTQWLSGVKAGVRSERVGMFGKFQAGLIHFGRASSPIICLAVFPVPLGCQVAAGKTDPAFDLGGVFEVYPSRRSLIRFDLSDNIIRYRGSFFKNPKGATHHNLKFNLGVGFRF